MDKKLLCGMFLLLLIGASSFAAKPIDLSHQPVTVLKSFLPTLSVRANGETVKENIKELDRSTDFNQTLHVRLSQTYSGYPVWGADAVMHIPQAGKSNASLANLVSMSDQKTSMNGILYQDLSKDLANPPRFIFEQAQAWKATQEAIKLYRQQAETEITITRQQSQLMVYVDQANKAHWAFLVSFFASPTKAHATPENPTYIMDAVSFQVHKQWNDLKTNVVVAADGGGLGGNGKKQFIYDGLAGHVAKLAIQRGETTDTCYLQNDEVLVKDDRDPNPVVAFSCKKHSPDHNNVYWDGEFDAVNGGYSPANDALFGGRIIKGMYQDWYGVPVLIENGKPMKLTMIVHLSMENAYWDGKAMNFGDGGDKYYPFTGLGVAAHEISHGFTQQHSNLAYYGQSGGMNEAFSDMADQAAQYYAYGSNNWMHDAEITKAEGKALRYMDKPSKDCEGGTPGVGCSIDHMSQYKDGIDVHHSSGIFNRAFYLMGTSSGWNAKKAFDVMVKANMHYWTTHSTFIQGACGVLSAAKDYGYDLSAVKQAFKTVGVNTSKC